jgi:hypothetical protein
MTFSSGLQAPRHPSGAMYARRFWLVEKRRPRCLPTCWSSRGTISATVGSSHLDDTQRKATCQNCSVQRLFSLALVLVLAVLAAGCGSKSSEPTSTADWADGVCSAITTWAGSIKSSADSLKGGNLTQDSLKSAGDEMNSATDTLESDLKDLGKPDTQSGQQAKDSIDQLSSDLSADSDSIKTALDGVSDPSDVPSATATVSSTLATMQSQVTSTVDSLKQLDAQGELQTAFQQSSACQQLSSSS